jgi:hypothetical protein
MILNFNSKRANCSSFSRPKSKYLSFKRDVSASDHVGIDCVCREEQDTRGPSETRETEHFVPGSRTYC